MGFKILTFGVFFSVFLLTSTGLSYLTSDEFGGIMVKKQNYAYNLNKIQKIAVEVHLYLVDMLPGNDLVNILFVKLMSSHYRKTQTGSRIY